MAKKFDYDVERQKALTEVFNKLIKDFKSRKSELMTNALLVADSVIEMDLMNYTNTDHVKVSEDDKAFIDFAAKILRDHGREITAVSIPNAGMRKAKLRSESERVEEKKTPFPIEFTIHRPR